MRKITDEFSLDNVNFNVPAQTLPPPSGPTKQSIEITVKGMAMKVVEGFTRVTRYDVELEKGVVLTKQRIDENFDLYKQYAEMWSIYPDLFLDFIKPVDSVFKLAFYQRIFLRALTRFQKVYCTAPRGFSKSFITILAIMLLCIFRPNYHTFICAPGKEQGAKIGNEKIHEIWKLWPLLKHEVIGEGNFGKDYVTLNYRNGSILDIVGALDTTRGGRRNGKEFAATTTNY